MKVKNFPANRNPPSSSSRLCSGRPSEAGAFWSAAGPAAAFRPAPRRKQPLSSGPVSFAFRSAGLQPAPFVTQPPPNLRASPPCLSP